MRLGKTVIGVRAGTFGNHEQVEMVVEIAADAGLVEHHRNPQLAQMIGGADARELQQPRRADCAGAQDHLTLSKEDTFARNLDAGSATILDDNAQDLRAGPNREIWAIAGRAEIGLGGRRTHDIALRQLIVANALRRLAGQVFIAWNADRLGRVEIGLADRQRRGGARDPERTALPVPAVIEAIVVLSLAEIREHILVAPAGTSGLAPLVIVQRMAAGVDLGVDSRAAAQHPGLSETDPHVVHVPLRHGGPTP